MYMYVCTHKCTKEGLLLPMHMLTKRNKSHMGISKRANGYAVVHVVNLIP